MSKVKRN